jgi:N-carbamoylputrescine amidase
MKAGKIKVGLIQTSVEDDKARHVQKTLEKVREAASKGAKLICLQELFASPYF